MIELDRRDVLSVRRLPGRLDNQQTVDLLGFQPHDLPVLVRHKFLKPLGTPTQSATKWFSSKLIIKCMEDDAWLSKATQVIARHWQKAHRRRTTPST